MFPMLFEGITAEKLIKTITVSEGKNGKFCFYLILDYFDNL